MIEEQNWIHNILFGSIIYYFRQNENPPKYKIDDKILYY